MKLETQSVQKRTVFIVDDHPLIRESLAALINRQNDLVVCAEAGDGSRALELLPKIKPDIVVLDLSLPDGSGIELIKKFISLSPSTRILVLSMHDESFYAERALRAGALGYVMKHETAKQVIDALRDILLGKLFVSASLASELTSKYVRGGKAPGGLSIENLSDRELEIFQLLGKGIETRQIAEQLNLSIKTVQTHYANIKKKLDLDNATELIREAVRWFEHTKQKT